MVDQDYLKSFLKTLIQDAEKNDTKTVEEFVQKIVAELEGTLVHS
ncbi:hypothetical protein [Pseudogracilibacillus sp. SO10305]